MTWLRHTATAVVMYPVGVLIWHWRVTHTDPHPWGQCLLFGLTFSAIAGVISLLQQRQRQRDRKERVNRDRHDLAERVRAERGRRERHTRRESAGRERNHRDR
jgi:hypothetical protein